MAILSLLKVREIHKKRERREEAEDGANGVDIHQRFVANDASSAVGTRCHRSRFDVPRFEADQIRDQRLDKSRSICQVRICVSLKHRSRRSVPFLTFYLRALISLMV